MKPPPAEMRRSAFFFPQLGHCLFGFATMLSKRSKSCPQAAQVYSYEIGKRLGGSFYAFADAAHRKDGDPLIYESLIEEDVRTAD